MLLSLPYIHHQHHQARSSWRNISQRQHICHFLCRRRFIAPIRIAWNQRCSDPCSETERIETLYVSWQNIYPGKQSMPLHIPSLMYCIEYLWHGLDICCPNTLMCRLYMLSLGVFYLLISPLGLTHWIYHWFCFLVDRRWMCSPSLCEREAESPWAQHDSPLFVVTLTGNKSQKRSQNDW